LKAVKLVGKRELRVADVDKPAKDGVNVLIKVSNCGICGSDIHFWNEGVGAVGYQGLILGHELDGIIEDTGSRNDLKQGDRVAVIPMNPCGECDTCLKGLVNLCENTYKRPQPGQNGPGGYAEYILARPDMVRRLPDTISDLEGAMIEPATVGLHAVKEAGVKRGDRVLIVGGGTIGLLCAAWSRIQGASFIAITEANAERAAKARGMGNADMVFDAADKGLKSSIKKAAGGGVDVAIDASASDAGINSALMLLRPKGTLVLAGISFSPQSLLTLVATMKEIAIRPSYAYLPGDFDSAIDSMARGILKTERFISRTIGMSGAQEAFESLDSRKTGDLKVVIGISG
jgi:2-desacetyl-2-hydroxyethyl bacteriochlorophyllide A dehydrogenase